MKRITQRTQQRQCENHNEHDMYTTTERIKDNAITNEDDIISQARYVLVAHTAKKRHVKPAEAHAQDHVDKKTASRKEPAVKQKPSRDRSD